MKEFVATFQISRMVLFTVDYYTLGSNGHPYFSTDASQFVRNKRDYNRCGQCQNDVLPKGSVARKFFKKWDKHHLHQLTDEQLSQLQEDLEMLKKSYNYMIMEQDVFGNEHRNYFNFYECKELSMMEVKKVKKIAV